MVNDGWFVRVVDAVQVVDVEAGSVEGVVEVAVVVRSVEVAVVGTEVLLVVRLSEVEEVGLACCSEIESCKLEVW